MSRKPHVTTLSSPTATIDRRAKSDRRLSADRREKSIPVTVEHRDVERRVKVNRRRQIDPTTCERDYTPDEIEFMGAMDSYKRRSGRMFPTCSEVLEVITLLGYVKIPQSEAPASPLVGYVQDSTIGVAKTPVDPQQDHRTELYPSRVD